MRCLKYSWSLPSPSFVQETEEELRNAIETTQPQEDQRGQTLGTDRHGNIYIHFPQFCGPDLRIYRQKKPPVPEVEEEEEVPEQKPAKVKRGLSYLFFAWRLHSFYFPDLFSG